MAKIVIKPGDKFGKLTVIKESERHRKTSGALIRMVEVECECGEIVIKNLTNVVGGSIKSCGCLLKPNGDKVEHTKRSLIEVKEGQVYNDLTIIEELPRRRNSVNASVRWVKVKCKCGKVFDVGLTSIRKGNTKSCGCSKLNGNRKTNIDYTNVRFGKLVVLKELPGKRRPGGSIARIMECECDCGTVKSIRLGDLKLGKTLSCGCYAREVSSQYNSMEVEIGTKRGYMTLLKESDKVTKYKEDGGMLSSIRYVMVKCDSCGYVEEMTLRRFMVDSQPDHCGCLTSKTTMDRLDSKELIIERYDHLEIIKELEPVEYYEHDGITYKQRMVEAQCVCGNVGEYKYKDILLHFVKSCGCKNHFNSHGLCKDENTGRMYNRWRNMLSRCYNQRDPNYHHYGGRGVTVCERWRESCENFIEDMGFPPTWEHTNDRIDVDGNYEPSNCRWADQQTQSLNKRTANWYKRGDPNPTV